MAAVLGPPGVRIERFAHEQRIYPARIDVPVFVVVAERGPIDVPTRVGSWPEYRSVFGGFTAAGYGAEAAKAFFENGGQACWIVRVVAPLVESTQLLTAVSPSETVLVDLAGIALGAAVTLTQAALSRTYLVTGVDTATGTVRWDRPLHEDFDLTLPVDVATGASSSAAPVAGGGGSCLLVRAATPGRWGNRLTVTIGPGTPSATTNKPDEPDDRTFTVVHSTVGFAVGTTVVVSQTIAGVVTTATRVVYECDRRAGLLRWSSPLPLAIDPTKPMTLRSRPFTVSIAEAGVVREVHDDLHCSRRSARYVDAVLAPSAYVRAETIVEVLPDAQWVRLRGGRDGTAALSVDDVLGDDLVAFDDPASARGLATTVDHPEPAAVAVPELVHPGVAGFVVDLPTVEVDPCWPCQPPPAPPPPDDVEVIEGRNRFDDAVILAAQAAVIEHCERDAERLALLDPAGGEGHLGAVDLVDRAFRLPSSRAVLLVPWLAVVDPEGGSARDLRRVPPSGHYAGLLARVDADRGPWVAPAKLPLEWAHGLGARFSDDEHGLLNEAGVVVIRPGVPTGVVPMGVRTLSTDPAWVFVNVRRTMTWVRRTLRTALAWVAFEPLDRGLVRSIEALIEGLLVEVWSDGGLAGGSPDEAFFVHGADPATTPAGELRCDIGLALVRPAEFVIVQVRRSDNRLELVEAPERGSWP